MADRGIIFSGPMILALLAGKKTVTRRPVKQFADPDVATLLSQSRGVATFGHAIPDDPVPIDVRCRYLPGDRLWVKETWAAQHDFDAYPPGEIPSPKARLHYAATEPLGGLMKRTPLYMPRWASRITLEVLTVRVERLHEITEADAQREGVTRDNEPCDHVRRSCEEIGCLGPGYRSTYCNLWRAMHGYDKGPAAWKRNPWVWVISFWSTKARSQ